MIKPFPVHCFELHFGFWAKILQKIPHKIILNGSHFFRRDKNHYWPLHRAIRAYLSESQMLPSSPVIVTWLNAERFCSWIGQLWHHSNIKAEWYIAHFSIWSSCIFNRTAEQHYRITQQYTETQRLTWFKMIANISSYYSYIYEIFDLLCWCWSGELAFTNNNIYIYIW